MSSFFRRLGIRISQRVHASQQSVNRCCLSHSTWTAAMGGAFGAVLFTGVATADAPSVVPQGQKRCAQTIVPGTFDFTRHYYERVLNAQIHPIVERFMRLSLDQVATRYCHLHPTVDKDALIARLKYTPSHLRWAGADLFNVTDIRGRRQMVLIETNTCPSGQKSMPLVHDFENDQGGYAVIMGKTFLPFLDQVPSDMQDGVLAVIYDKNRVEASGYAASMAEATGEHVYLAEFYHNDPDPPIKFDEDGVMYVRIHPEESSEAPQWKKVRAAFRYVTQKPWTRIPITTKTLILNPVLSCLAGGRNKNLASKAYTFFNAELMMDVGMEGVQIRTPETIEDVTKAQIPLWAKRFGGVLVVKSPYSNAGQGVYTITTKEELDDFMNSEETNYDTFIVQSLIGNSTWSSIGRQGLFYHVGTIPTKKGDTYVADIRMMVHTTDQGWRPIAIYSRRAVKPLVKNLDSQTSASWDMLGTNLSVKLGTNQWISDTNRLILMDRKDFNALGIGIDDLIDAYVQTVLAATAIDKMGKRFLKDGKFKKFLFRALNDDQSLINEILDENVPIFQAPRSMVPPSEQSS